MLLTQDGLLHLRHRVARQFVGHDDALWKLVVREPVTQRRYDFGFAQRRAGAGNNDRRDPFAEIRMRDADDRTLQHTRKRIDLQLDLIASGVL